MHFVATGLPFSRATCNFIPLTRHARAAMAISTSEIRTDDVLSVPAPLPLCECESAKATLARAMSRAVAIANAGFVTVKSLHLPLVARMSAELIHRRRCECRRDVMRGLQTIVTSVRMGTRYAPRGRVSQRRPLASVRGANARPSGCRTRGSAREWSRGDLVVERCFSSQWFMLAGARVACNMANTAPLVATATVTTGAETLP
jgi:hypothetical protein